ncbi:MAG: DUF6899 family protein [Candidatus Hodarchaeales archaeon]|jgi:hypothetical protein
MPYVKQGRRPSLDEVVDELVKAELEIGDMEVFLFHLAINMRALWAAMPVDSALEKARSVGVKPNGDINYIIFKYCKYHIAPSYNNYKTFMGEIYIAMRQLSPRYGKFKDEYREAAAEIRRRILGPYEDSKIKENGDV